MIITVTALKYVTILDPRPYEGVGPTTIQLEPGEVQDYDVLPQQGYRLFPLLDRAVTAGLLTYIVTDTPGAISRTIELEDDVHFDLPAASAGFGLFQIGDNEEYASVTWSSAGVPVIFNGSANVVSTDTGSGSGKFCFFDNGTHVRIVNRLGATKEIKFLYY